jgi:hypothetical protein
LGWPENFSHPPGLTLMIVTLRAFSDYLLGLYSFIGIHIIFNKMDIDKKNYNLIETDVSNFFVK